MNKRQFRSDDPERRQWQDPEKILTSIGVAPGMVFIDIGCGHGYFALPAARRVVCLKGKVYAVDSDAAAIDRLRNFRQQGKDSTICFQKSERQKKP